MQSIYIPKVIAFISHYPYFYAWEVYLRCIWQIVPKSYLPIEYLLMHYFYDILAPFPNKFIQYDIGGGNISETVLFACKNIYDIPILELNNCIPFTQLSKDRIIIIFKLLLLERRLMFISSNEYDLYQICEIFVNLLFPLRWRYLYLPLLDFQLTKALISSYASHLPFLVGMPNFLFIRPEIRTKIPNNTYIINLDRNEIKFNECQLKTSIIITQNMKVLPTLPGV